MSSNGTQEAFIKPEGREHKIKVRLEVLGVSQREFARFAGMTSQHFGKWVRSDGREMKPETVLKLADLLGVKPNFIEDVETWDGLFSPFPNWLQGAIDEKARKEAEGRAKRIERLSKGGS